ncbi:MAG TPA: glycerol-3-phosphate dehydrogenase subunit GlpB [Gaiellales bacterium]|nr:glycerol-3-phosphate dehydrogenase subunit GlpB [Gaiellales bacterium]
MSRVLVVGAGLSGLSCALRLADGGAPVTVIATGTGSLQLGGATIDLLGYAPALVRQPLDALAGLPADHPYSLLGRERVAAATGWLAERLPALRLRGDGGENLLLATALGAVRPTAVAPAAVAAGDLRPGGPVVFANVRSLRDFFPELIAANVAASPEVRVETRAAEADVDVRGDADASPIALARALELPDQRARITAALRDAIGDAAGARVGLPAALGVDGHAEVAEAVADALGAEVFEVPTAPPSVPGIRLYRALLAELRNLQVRLIVGSTAVAGVRDGDRIGSLDVQVSGRVRSFAADAVVLATGGLATGGLEADRDCLREPVLGLPVAGDPGADRYDADPFREHAVDRAGIRVDARMRPVGDGASAVHPNVHAVGALVHGAVPWRELSGNGLALGTGLAAADAILEERAA